MGGGEPQSVSGVLAAARPADTGTVALRKGVVNRHAELGERCIQAVKKGIEALRADRVGTALMKNRVGREQFGDCLSAAFVPHLFEPAGPQMPLQVSHCCPPMVVYAKPYSSVRALLPPGDFRALRTRTGGPAVLRGREIFDD